MSRLFCDSEDISARTLPMQVTVREQDKRGSQVIKQGPIQVD